MEELCAIVEIVVETEHGEYKYCFETGKWEKASHDSDSGSICNLMTQQSDSRDRKNETGKAEELVEVSLSCCADLEADENFKVLGKQSAEWEMPIRL